MIIIIGIIEPINMKQAVEYLSQNPISPKLLVCLQTSVRHVGWPLGPGGGHVPDVGRLGPIHIP